MAHSTATLAQGCFGKVYKEKYNDKWAAIKRVPMRMISKKDLDRECDVYKKAEHSNIVKLLGPVTLKDGKYVIPMEFIFGEDLETTIFNVSKSKIPLNPAAKSTIIVGMCEGLRHLHSRDIVHQDLKPDNIMVEHDTNRAVIIDLGLAKFFKNGLNSARDMGNEAYSAPEVLQTDSQRDQRSDVWAMGKIIAELCARVRLVTPSVNPEKIKDTLKDSPYCKAVCRMVQPDPSVRASMAGVISAIRVAGAEKPKTSAARTQTLAPPGNTPFHAQNHSPSPMNKAHSPSRFSEPGPNRSPSPLNRERSPRPEVKTFRSTPQPQGITSPPKKQEKNLQLVPKGGANLTPEFAKMALYKEVKADLPFDLPENGRVVVRSYEEKDGGTGSWEQKEVVTREGRIVKYNDVKMKM
ncbi:uncharacterized protein [Eucyclogobius newberryi]|uniref:uncharacterized protein n=1 Tax=Eucyclogobius newberryi TaxID=166745 RepID=UPI003B599B9A